MIRVAARLTHDRFRVLTAGQVAAVARARLNAGLSIEAAWKGDVRVDTGNYRRSIHTDDGQHQTVVSSNVDYAIYNEYGTHRMAARPSATQAAENERRAYAADAAREIAHVR